ncbi:LacI family transcriptional regulator [Psychromonas marina]|uniref:LacI family transcriptional regulator n=1 Tax=Psychromonas marina TaxID=88364 RepID=A0ABQ6E2B8_9GAMM|nr:substrate-binding domain-containing protein [Psychromonas marina]GLS91563.1 LacI family transcriptional regulator [Psychromonas marina]
MSKTKTSSYDVAKLAGVSPSTISRFFNRTSYVSPDKVQKIEEAIRSLQYKPNSPLKGKSNQRSMTIGVIIQDPVSPFSSHILNDMEQVLIEQGYSLVISSAHWNQALATDALQYLSSNNVDGVIVVTGNLSEQQVVTFAAETPVVVIGYNVEGENVRSIHLDQELGGYIATLHLLQQGHKHIAHIKGLNNQPDSMARFKGYQRALNEWGLPVMPKLVRQGDFQSETAYQETLQLIKSNVHFTAIFAANDLSAYGAIKALHDNNIKVPDDVSVIGFDDLSTSQYFTPALTTLKQPIYELGGVSAQTILNLLRGRDHVVKTPPIDLIVRDSTRKLNT